MSNKFLLWIGICVLSLLLVFVFFATTLFVHTWRSFRSDIWRAINEEDIPALRGYAKAGGDLELGRSIRGTTPLLESIRNEKFVSYQTLIELGASPNTLCRGGGLPIQQAAAKDDPSWLHLALSHGGNPNLLNTKGRGHARSTPIFWAIYFGAHENITTLVDVGANVYEENEVGEIVISVAAGHMRFRAVKYLLDHNVDPLRHGANGHTLVERMETTWPAFYGPTAEDEYHAYLEVRRWLVDHGYCHESDLFPLEKVIVRPDLRDYN